MTFKQTAKEAFLILIASVLLGFAYTGIMGKGSFAPDIGFGEVGRIEETAPAFISYDEAITLHTSGEAMFIDARSPYDFHLGHIKNAINVPLKDFHPGMLGALDKNQLLVTYCDGEECNSSIQLATKLDSLGFSNVKIFFGGWKEWTARNQAVEQ